MPGPALRCRGRRAPPPGRRSRRGTRRSRRAAPCPGWRSARRRAAAGARPPRRRARRARRGPARRATPSIQARDGVELAHASPSRRLTSAPAAGRSGSTRRPGSRGRACGSRARRRAARSRGCGASRAGAGRDSISRIAARSPTTVTPIAPRSVISFSTILSETKSGTGLKPFTPARITRAAGRRVVERLGDRRGRVGRHVDHDVGAAPVGELAHAAADTSSLLDVDGVVRAELAGERELLRVARRDRSR